MRPSCLGAVLSLLLLFIFLSSTVQGIRLEKSFKSAAGHPKVLHEGGVMVNTRNGDEAVIVCKEGKEQCSGTEKKTAYRELNHKSHHWLHEDYYGPRRHRPKHH